MEIKPCPFCGHTDVGMTMPSTYRWLAATCRWCGCVAPEVRIDTTKVLPGEQYGPTDIDNAMLEWNRRGNAD